MPAGAVLTLRQTQKALRPFSLSGSETAGRARMNTYAECYLNTYANRCQECNPRRILHQASDAQSGCLPRERVAPALLEGTPLRPSGACLWPDEEALPVWSAYARWRAVGPTAAAANNALHAAGPGARAGHAREGRHPAIDRR